MEKEEIFLFEISVVGFLRSNFTSPEQECTLLKSGIGVDDNDEATASRVQAGAREESSSLPIYQQQGMTAWSTDQNRQFDRGRSRVTSFTFLKRYMFAMCTCLFFPLCFVCCLLHIFPVLSTNCRSRYERRYELFGCRVPDLPHLHANGGHHEHEQLRMFKHLFHSSFKGRSECML